MRWDDSASRSPRAPGSLPQGTHPRSEEPGHEEAYPGIRERKRRYVLFPVLELRLPGPEGRKCVTSTVRDRPNLNDREVPGGWECSNPERFAHGQRRTAQFAYAETRRRQPRSWEVAWDSSREEPHERGFLTNTHPSTWKRKRLAQCNRLRLGTGGRGEVEGDSKGFRSTATTEEGTRGRTRPTASPSTGKPL